MLFSHLTTYSKSSCHPYRSVIKSNTTVKFDDIFCERMAYFVAACFSRHRNRLVHYLLNNKKKLGIGRVRNDHPHQSAAWSLSKIFPRLGFVV